MAVEIADVDVRRGKENDAPSPGGEIADRSDLLDSDLRDVAQDQHLGLVQDPEPRDPGEMLSNSRLGSPVVAAASACCAK